MRLWSLHPAYLDARGLVALWREGLLARKVLQGQTKGYRQHPQLERFRAHPQPLAALNAYLWEVYAEAANRGYHFNHHKLGPRRAGLRLSITTGQLQFELRHLKRKLKLRDTARYRLLRGMKKPLSHPLFKVIAGGIAPWERGR